MKKEEFPPALCEIPDVPESLKYVGEALDTGGMYLAVVGSRANSTYGADVCDKLIRGLAGSGIYIVSGLALGIDSIAHRSAMKAGLKTVAFPGSGLGEEVLYPATNISLAKEILASGGTLVSEYGSDQRSQQWMFPKRNRLMAGLAKATLVIEASAKSGTLITARLALDYNREVLAVPGNITNTNALGPNLLIKQGATPITRSEDILEVFGFKQETLFEEKERVLAELSVDERELIELLIEPMPRDDILAASDRPVSEINSLLSAMELKGLIKEEYGEIRLI
jgi:DNA processing protein